MNMMSEPLCEPTFRSVEQALTFALRHDHSHVDQSLANKMAAKTGSRITELDGPGESGIIRRAVSSLGPFKASILIAKFGTKEIICSCRSPCCSRRMEAPEWSEAIAFLAFNAIKAAPKSAPAFELRKGIVENYFDKKERSIGKLADAARVHRNTASDMSSKIKAHLKEAEKQARADIEGTLINAGIVASV